jgi:hypothetical protein
MKRVLFSPSENSRSLHYACASVGMTTLLQNGRYRVKSSISNEFVIPTGPKIHVRNEGSSLLRVTLKREKPATIYGRGLFTGEAVEFG